MEEKCLIVKVPFFGDTVLEVTERNMWVIEIKYFVFYCKSYYFC